MSIFSRKKPPLKFDGREDAKTANEIRMHEVQHWLLKHGWYVIERTQDEPNYKWSWHHPHLTIEEYPLYTWKAAERQRNWDQSEMAAHIYSYRNNNAE